MSRRLPALGRKLRRFKNRSSGRPARVGSRWQALEARQLLAVMAVDDTAMTDEDTVLSVAAAGVLENDLPGGEPLVYEGFQYETAGGVRSESDLFDGQPNEPGDIDATGLGGMWQDTTPVVASSDAFLQSGSLEFGNLATLGNSVRTDSNLNNDIFTRPITADLSATATGEIWFSFLADKLQNNNNAAEGGLVIGTQPVSSSQVQTDDGSSGLRGFAVAPDTNGDNWRAYAWDGAGQSDGGSSVTVGVGGGDVHLLVGRISFDTGAGGADEFTLFDYDLTSSGGNVTADMTHLNQVGNTVEVDVSQADLDTLSLTRQVNTAYDEIRLGSTLGDVVPATPAVFSHEAQSAQGAAVTVNADGSYTYDPTGSAALQALNDGDTLTDTFDYTIIEQGDLLSTARLTAYYPLNDGPVGTPVTGADDVIDDPSHPARDATSEGTGGTWVDDPDRGIVYSTVEGERLDLGTQGIDLTSEGFTWSLWVNIAASNTTDSGADVIIGSRTGIWNKLQPNGLERWADIAGYDIADDTWHHVALTGSPEPGAEVSLYIDGNLIGSDSTFFNDDLTVDDKFELGGSSQFSEDVTGLISDVSIWKDALTLEQIQALANETATPPELNPELDTATVSVEVTGVTDFNAIDDSYSVEYMAENLTTFNVAEGANDLLANDDSPNPLTVQSIESSNSGGAVTLSGDATITTDLGASVTVNEDGSFSYDPSGSAALEDLNNNTLTDSFLYTMTDGSASSTGSVTIDVTVIGPPAAGDVSIFSAATAGELVNTSDFIHDFDTELRRSQSHVLAANGEDIALTAGHHLVIYNSRFDSSGGSNRSEIQTNLNLDGTDLPVGWSQGYIRRSNGQDETFTSGGGVINVANDGDLLQLQSFRTDDNGGAGVQRVDGNSAIQLIKLDDNWDYARLNLAADQAGPSNGTFVPVQYDAQNEVDTDSFTHTNGSQDITLRSQGKYLVLANTFVNITQDRSALIQRLTLDGTEVQGSSTNVYIRGNQNSTSDGAASIGMIVETTAADQVLNVEGALDVDRASTYIGGRTGVTIVKLPDDAEYIRLNDTSGDQDLNTATPTPLNYNDATSQLEVDSAFTHSTATDSSRVGVNENGDYLFFASQFDSDDGVQRGFYNQSWQVSGSGTSEPNGQTGRYSRNTGGADQFGNWSGFVSGLQAGDYVETVTQQLGNTGTNTADVLALQGVNLASLFAVSLDAVDDDYTTSDPITENQTLVIPDGSNDLLANDTPPDATITAFDATSVNGAAVTVNADGSFTYDPSGSAAIQDLDSGESLTDTFTYTITDGVEVTSTLFTEDFESPDIMEYQQGTFPGDWVGATQGFRGNNHGLVDKDTGDFTADDPNDQAYAFRYTNSGLTSAEGVIGDLALDTTYTISFDVATDLGGPTVPGQSYRLEFVAFDETEGNSSRTEARGQRPGTILAFEAGQATDNNMSDAGSTVSFTFTPDATDDAALIGNDLGVRFIGATESAVVDNVSVTATAPRTATGTASVLVNGEDDFVAVDDDYTTSNPITEDQTLVIPDGSNDLLANDTPPDATITAFDATSVNGAAVTVNADGSFTYDPSGSAAIQDLDSGESLTDTFTYTIGSDTSSSAVILSTDFNGRTVSGDTASNITWTTNGVADPGDLTAIETQEGDAGNQLGGLFDTADSSSHFAPDLNTDNEDNWSVSIPLQITASSVTVDDIVLDGDHFSNGGAFQTASRDTDFVVSITGSSSGEIATETKSSGNVTTDWLITFFDTTPAFSLADSESWTLTIATTNFPNNSGNNTGLDGVTVNGSFTESVSDTATVSVLVNGEDDFAAVDDDYTTSNPIGESDTLDTDAAGADSLLANDIPNNATIVGINGTTSLSGTSTEGAQVTVSADGSFVYDTNGQFENLTAGEMLTDTFTYTITDGNGTTATATASILVNGENDPPSGVADAIDAPQDSAVMIDVLANDTDPDIDGTAPDDMLTVTAVDNTGTTGMAALANGGANVSYDPQANFKSLDDGDTATTTFTYTLEDNSGATSSATVTVTIEGANDAPVADAGAGYTISEGDSLTLDATASSDVDAGETLTFAWDIDGDGMFDDATGAAPTIPASQLEAIADGPGSFDVAVQVSDGDLMDTATATVTVNNTPPVATVTPESGETLLNAELEITVSADDPSTADDAAGFTYELDFDGDGTIDQTMTGPASGATFTVQYTALGSFTLEGFATDKDGGRSAVATATVEVVPVGIDDEGNLVAVGTGISDRIIFSPSNNGIKVRYNNEFYPLGGGGFVLDSGARLLATGSGGNDMIITSGSIEIEAEFDGGEGNDYLAASPADDTLIGGPGNDVILAGEGDNLLIGDTRDDSGPGGSDRLEGRSGDDTLFGGSGNDRLNGREGNDILDGGADNDFLFGGLGDDLLAGRGGNDTVNGSFGNDVIYGGEGADQLFGSGDNDLLFGGTGSDRLRGDSGDDTLVGGTSGLEADTEDSLDALLAGGSLQTNVQAALDAWFASQSESSRMLYEPFTDDGTADELSGGSGADTLQSGSNDQLRNVREEDTVL